MIQAIGIDDERTVANLLKRGVDVDTVAPDGSTLLMLAAKAGKPPMVKTLLAARPKVNARNSFGETALMLAAFAGHLEVVRLLLAQRRRGEPAGMDGAHLQRGAEPDGCRADAAQERRPGQRPIGERHDRAHDGGPGRPSLPWCCS